MSSMTAAFTGGIYLGIAGINHLIKKPAGANEWIAMMSDIFIFLVMVDWGNLLYSNEIKL